MTNYYAKLGRAELSGGLTLVTGTVEVVKAGAAKVLTLGFRQKLCGIQFGKLDTGPASGTGIPYCVGTTGVTTAGTVLVRNIATTTACTYWFTAIGY